ncbi:MAG: hypothetical protein WCP55_15655, partial [Lentisphaerota bacterium]
MPRSQAASAAVISSAPRGILELRLYGEFEEHPTTGAYVKGTSTVRITRFNDKPGSSLFETHDWA